MPKTNTVCFPASAENAGFWDLQENGRFRSGALPRRQCVRVWEGSGELALFKSTCCPCNAGG